MEEEKRTVVCVAGAGIDTAKLLEKIQKAHEENETNQIEIYFIQEGELMEEKSDFSDAIIGNADFFHDRMKDLLEEMSEFKYPVFLENPLDIESPPCYEKNSWLQEKKQNQKQREIRKQINPVPNRVKMLQIIRRKTGKENVA